MSKPLLFYVIDERTDVDKYCKKKGLKPHKYKDMRSGVPDDPIIKAAVQYVKGDYIYDVLQGDECYSRYMETLMRLPKLSYEKLINVALNSKHYEERIGAMGMILKDHPKEFKQSLLSMIDAGTAQIENKKNIKRMSVYVYDFINDSHHIRQLENIRNLCEELKLKL